MPQIFIDEKRALRLVMEMMAIPGSSTEESRVSRHLTDQLKNAAVPDSAITTDKAARRSSSGGSTGNLIVKLPGTFRGPRRLLMAHIDTVPLCVGCRPIRRGAFIESRDPDTALGGDNRAGATVLLSAVLEILDRKLPHPPLTFLWTVQEEIGLLGARHVAISRLGRPQLCFNWDGGDPSIATIGATGACYIDIEVTGIASHAGAHPEQGVSAAGIAAKAISALVDNGWHGAIRKGRKEGTSNIGVVNGGQATNVVMESLDLHAEARSHQPAFRERIVSEFRKAFDRAVNSIRNDTGESGSIDFSSETRYEAFCLSPSEPCVQHAMKAIHDAGLDPQTRICNGGLDANWLTAHGLPTVSLGCGQQGIHTVDECLHVESFLTGCRIALKLATDE